MLQVTDPNPFHFNDSDEAVDTIFELVTSSNKKVSLRKAKPEICLWLYSALYNPGAGVVAEASGGSIALKSKGEVGTWGGVTHYTYQTLFSDRQIFKTQTTSIPNFSQNLRSPNTEALQEVGLNRAIADFPNQQSVVRF